MRNRIVALITLVFFGACVARDLQISLSPKLVRVDNSNPSEAQVTLEMFAQRSGFIDRQFLQCSRVRVYWSRGQSVILQEDIALEPAVVTRFNSSSPSTFSISARRPMDSGEFTVCVTAYVSTISDKVFHSHDPVSTEFPITIQRNQQALLYLTAAVLGLVAVFCGLLAMFLRGKFRLHLSTCLVELLATGVLLTINSRETFGSTSLWNGGIGMFKIYSSPGWPFPLLSGQGAGVIDSRSLIMDALIFLSILVFVAILMEWLFKRHPAQRGAPAVATASDSSTPA